MNKSLVGALVVASIMWLGYQAEAQAVPLVLGTSGQPITFTGDGAGGLSVSSPALTGFGVYGPHPVGFYQIDPLSFTTIAHDASGNFFANPNSGVLSFLGGDGDAFTASTSWEVVLTNVINPVIFGTATITFATGDAAFLADFSLGSNSSITLAFDTLSSSVDLVTLSATTFPESAAIAVGAVTPAPVPEPTSAMLYAMGLLGFALMRRQRANA